MGSAPKSIDDDPNHEACSANKSHYCVEKREIEDKGMVSLLLLLF